jgi:guanylate kinase
MFFVISGPSGSGKSAITRSFLEEKSDVVFSVSHTSRKKRDTEIDGRDYHFVSEEEFEKMKEENGFIEWAVVHGNMYGTSRAEVEKKGTENDLLLDIDVQGAQQIRDSGVKALFVFILPPSFQELKKRLEDRGDEDAASIRKRLQIAKEEVLHYDKFDYVIINDRLDRAAQDLKAIVKGTRCRLDSQEAEISLILESFSDKDTGK